MVPWSCFPLRQGGQVLHLGNGQPLAMGCPMGVHNLPAFPARGFASLGKSPKKQTAASP